MAIKDKGSKSVKFADAPSSSKDAVDSVDKKYSFDSDEEDHIPNKRKLNVNDIDGQEKTTNRVVDGQKITPFNLDDEKDEGYFDENGTFIFVDSNQGDVRDSWLDSIDDYKVPENIPTKTVKEESPDPLARLSTVEILQQIVEFLKPSESVAKALKRLGGTQLSASQRLKLKKQGRTPVDATKDKESLEKLTSLSDYILNSGRDTIYQDTFEKLSFEIKSASDDIFAEDEGPAAKRSKLSTEDAAADDGVKWHYKLKDTDELLHGPYSSKDMLEMNNNGHFKEGTVVCKASSKDTFYSINRIHFDDYID